MKNHSSGKQKTWWEIIAGSGRQKGPTVENHCEERKGREGRYYHLLHYSDLPDKFLCSQISRRSSRYRFLTGKYLT